MRLTETTPTKKYRIFTITLPDNMVSYYRSAGVYPDAIVEIIAHRATHSGGTVALDALNGFRFNIHNDYAHDIIVEEVEEVTKNDTSRSLEVY
jgi:Fe2+ transport system protein FeoA